MSSSYQKRVNQSFPRSFFPQTPDRQHCFSSQVLTRILLSYNGLSGKSFDTNSQKYEHKTNVETATRVRIILLGKGSWVWLTICCTAVAQKTMRLWVTSRNLITHFGINNYYNRIKLSVLLGIRFRQSTDRIQQFWRRRQNQNQILNVSQIKVGPRHRLCWGSSRWPSLPPPPPHINAGTGLGHFPLQSSQIIVNSSTCSALNAIQRRD
jgi:hypothetical protein